MGTFYENYLRLCNEIKKSPSAVALELGLTKTAVSNWKNRGTSPTDANAQLIADYFKITVSELLGENEKKPTTPEGSEPFEGYSDLTENEREKVKEYAAFLLASRNKK